jgi:hypothetical protein
MDISFIVIFLFPRHRAISIPNAVEPVNFLRAQFPVRDEMPDLIPRRDFAREALW